MRSHKVELHRFGSDAGVVQDRYIVAQDGFPARPVEPQTDQLAILRALDKLRYRDGADAQVVNEAIQLLAGIVQLFLKDLPDLNEPLQIDIVTDKVELWALPFELVRDRDGQFLLGRKDRSVLLTRRVRGRFVEKARPWPIRPRVLFAWAGDVAWKDHQNALHEALEPWIGPIEEHLVPDPRPALTELGKATLEKIREECLEAAKEKKPYTHIHLLAHGDMIPGNIAAEASFGVALKDRTVSAEELVDAVRAKEADGPYVVTLGTCDSANAMNTLMASGKVAYELHRGGVPVVIGSQFPLTEPGAVLYTRSFYGDLLAKAKDVRDALRNARVALREAAEASRIAGHDWVSVTAHLQLPEGYRDQIGDASMKILLAQLNSTSRWAQRIVEDDKKASAMEAARIEELLERRIESLKEELSSLKEDDELLLENLGLLASAHKRLAELVIKNGGDGADQRSRDILSEAGRWYRKANDHNLSHHWTGTQHLAITGATAGRIPPEQRFYWEASLHAALREAALDPTEDSDTREKVIWALGSIAELYLLASLLPEPPLDTEASVEHAIKRLIELAEPDKVHAINSTWRQFRRYEHWWIHDHGFFKGVSDLSGPAKKIVSMLEPHVVR